jgi:hypothetical protein
MSTDRGGGGMWIFLTTMLQAEARSVGQACLTRLTWQSAEPSPRLTAGLDAASLEALIRDDRDEDAFVILDGWIVSRTEAECWAMVARELGSMPDAG